MSTVRNSRTVSATRLSTDSLEVDVGANVNRRCLALGNALGDRAAVEHVGNHDAAPACANPSQNAAPMPRTAGHDRDLVPEPAVDVSSLIYGHVTN